MSQNKCGLKRNKTNVLYGYLAELRYSVIDVNETIVRKLKWAMLGSTKLKVNSSVVRYTLEGSPNPFLSFGLD